MNLLTRSLLCATLLFCTVYLAPCFAKSPGNTEYSAPATKASTEQAASTNSDAFDKLPSNATETSSTDDVSTATKEKTTSAGVEAEKPRDGKSYTQSLINDLQDPAKNKYALGTLAELLGVAAGLMLITGAILAACVKKFGLVKLMVAVGVVVGVAAVAAPGITIWSDSAGVGTALTVFFLLIYNLVFFLPSILAFKDDTSKKWIVLAVNAAGFVVPGAGLVALYLALKDKRISADQPSVQ